MPLFTPTAHAPARAAKFRQAAFVYLHMAILYESAVYAMARNGALSASRMIGPSWVWLLVGALVAGAIFVGLLRWQNVTFTRVIWVIQGLRLPSLIGSAFITTVETGVTRGFYVTALVVVLINMWMLARAAWDL